MQIYGELIDNYVIVKKQKYSGKLYSRSNLGKLLSNNQIKLDLLESVYLLGENKIKIFKKKKIVDFQSLVFLATKQLSEFEIKYLVYKDLRNRGLAIRLCDKDVNTTFCLSKKLNKKKVQKNFILAFSERDILDISFTKNLINDISKSKGELWFAIVDEEGDITYYSVSIQNLKGNVSERKYSKGQGILLKNRIILFDSKLAKSLFNKEFYGKFFGEGLQLSLVEGLYLLEKNVISISLKKDKDINPKECKKIIFKLQPDIKSRLVVFSDLKKRGLIVKTGFKFGVHFRAYTNQPDETHAEYLIHVVDKNFKSIWAEMSRAVRLAHSVNKEIIFARVDGKNIDYVRFGRLRP